MAKAPLADTEARLNALQALQELPPPGMLRARCQRTQREPSEGFAGLTAEAGPDEGRRGRHQLLGFKEEFGFVSLQREC